MSAGSIDINPQDVPEVDTKYRRIKTQIPTPDYAQFFDELEEAHRQGREVKVNWRYDVDNERVAELAEEFKEDCSFSFNIIGQE